MAAYFNALSDTQRQIVELKMDGFTKPQIIERLRITENSYKINLEKLRNFDKVQLLFRGKKKDKKCVEEEINMSQILTQTAEKVNRKITRYMPSYRECMTIPSVWIIRCSENPNNGAM